MRRSRSVTAGAGLLLALLLTACNDTDGVDATDGPVASPSASTPAVTQPSPAPSEGSAEEQAVLAQYRKFFELAPRLHLTPPNDRAVAWAKVATDPSYTRTLGGIAAADSAGETFFGQYVIDPVVLMVKGSRATVRDCQDTSQLGRKKAATGEKVTVGQTNALAVVTMLHGPDGAWRVSEVAYRNEPC